MAAALVLLLLLRPLTCPADTGSSLGNRSGEGSTPFTGLVQSPDANLFTGAATSAIPIQVPPGRHRMTPQLALRYSSSAGPGPYGYGWDLPLGRIERSTRWGVPRPCDGGPHAEDFTLVLPGTAVDLVPAGPGDSPGTRVYRPRVEEAWLEAVLDTEENRWTVWDRSGTRFELGWRPEARFGTAPDVLAAASTDIFGHTRCDFTAAWALTGIEDPNGNRIDVTYYPAGDAGAPLLPYRIEYGANPRAGLPGHLFRVELRFAPRPDLLVSYRLGARAHVQVRLAEISVHTLVPAPAVIRTYRFAWAPGERSLLGGVSVVGSDGVPLLPPQSFAYSPEVPDRRTAPAVAPPGVNELRRTHRTGEVQQTLLDMNGDGKVDLVRADNGDGGTWSVYLGGPGVEADGSAPVELFSPDPILWHLPAAIRDIAADIRNVLADCNGSGGFVTCTRADVLDITGDGIPDFVDARPRGADGVAIWWVYPGTARTPETGSWGFSSQRIEWQSPYFFLDEVWNQEPQVSLRELVDMDGDGRPDLVRADLDTPGYPCFGGYIFPCPPPPEPRSLWRVHFNRGDGFDLEPTLVYAPRYVLRVRVLEGNDAGSTIQELADVNGDGLPDIVEGQSPARDPTHYACGDAGSCLVAFLNRGDGFEFAPTILATRPDGLMRYVRYANKSGADPVQHEVYRDFFDVNGDGLPDWVFHEIDRRGPRRALLNSGAALGNEIVVGPWDAPIRMEVDADSRAELFDVNGDGIPEFLDARHQGAWTIEVSRAAIRPFLLTAADNGLGGRTEIYYRSSAAYDNTGGDGLPDLPFALWTVAALRQTDGECAPPDGADPLREEQNPCIAAGREMVSLFAYEDGRYDAETRELRGFRKVYRRRLDGDPDTPDNATLSVFGQERSTAGRLLEWHRYAGEQALVAGKVNSWEVRPHPHGADRTQVFLGWSLTYRADIDAAQPLTTLRVNHEVDPWGNVRHSSVAGVAGEDRIDTYTHYATPRPGSRVHDRPSRARSTTRTASGEEVPFSEQVFLYDGDGTPLPEGQVERGNVRLVRRWHDRGTHPDPETRTDYDAFGNVEVTTDPLGKTVTIVHDPYGLYAVESIDHLGHTTTSAWDYRCGKAVERREPAQQGTPWATRSAYDDACRLTCVALPGDSLDSCTEEYEYVFRQAPDHSYVLHRVREPNRLSVPAGEKPGYLPTWTFYDALGRPRATETWRNVLGAEQRVRSDEVDYDGLGRVLRRYEPHPAGQPRGAATTIDYHLNGGAFEDPLGRPHRITAPDGRMTRVWYRGAQTESTDERGVRTVVTRDAHGRVIRTEVLDLDGSRLSLTEQAYDGRGQLLWKQQNGDPATRITLTYDSLGRKIEEFDPDAGGRWQYRYDAAGNLIWRNDPKEGQSLFYCHDDLHRVVRRIPLPTDSFTGGVCGSPAAPAPGETRYTYDSLAGEEPGSFRAGRLAREENDAATIEYWYDERGRVRRLHRTVRAGEDARPAAFAWEFDAAGRPAVVQYPDGERVATRYDSTGQPMRLEREDGGQVYVASAAYDLRGNPVQIELGNGVRETEERYGPEQRFRLRRLRVERGDEVLLALRYDTYTERGRIEHVVDERDPQGPLSRSAWYAYDGLGRLLAASGPNVNATYAYDAFGNIVRKGDRVLRHEDPSRPHQPTAACVCADAACTTATACVPIEHDANGNRLSHDGAQYEFDAEDRLARATIGGATERYLYGPAGERVAAVRPDGAPVYFFGELAESTADGWLQKYYFFGGRRVATTRVWWAAEATARAPSRLPWAVAGPQPRSLAGTAVLLCVGWLLIGPSRRCRRAAGITLHDGHVTVAATALLLAASGAPVAPSAAGRPWTSFGPAAARADEIRTTVLHPAADTEITSAYQATCPSSNLRGGLDHARIGRRSGSKSVSLHHALLRFDLSPIPYGATVLDAYLTLQVSEVVSSSTQSYSVAPLQATDWNETQATWTVRRCSVRWAHPGGDFDSSRQVAFSGPAGVGVFVISGLTGLVAGAVTSGEGRVEWLLRPADTSHNNSWVMRTREAPAAQQPALVVRWSPPPAAEGPLYYHTDHLGSVVVVTGPDGAVEKQVRYTPYGEVRGVWDAAGRSQAQEDPRAPHGFNGYRNESFTGLQYAGARYYDPQLGLFLTRDPAGQFANPYTFTGWDPVNRTDPSGAFVPELVATAITIAKWALASAAFGAYASMISASAQGATRTDKALLNAAGRGAVAGAAGVGMGVVLGAANIGAAALAGTLPENVTARSAMLALGEVAERSAYSAAASSAAGKAADATGAPPWVGQLAAIAAGYGMSRYYDSRMLYSRNAVPEAPAAGRPGVTTVSNTLTHTDVTARAAAAAGFGPDEAAVLVEANLGRDDGAFLLVNMDHFGVAARRAEADFLREAARAQKRTSYLGALGKASHHLQDQYALGHIFPGTHLIGSYHPVAKLPLAVLRGLVHQTFGGEVTFRAAQFDATLDLFSGRTSVI